MWILEVRPGYEEEYKKRHDEIWPELSALIKESGMKNYSIFRHGLKLYGYFETADLEKTIAHLNQGEVNKKWGEFMTPIMIFSRIPIILNYCNFTKTLKHAIGYQLLTL